MTQTFHHPFSTTRYTVSWQLRKFNALAVYHFSIMWNRYNKFSLISLNKCNLIAPDMAQRFIEFNATLNISEAGKILRDEMYRQTSIFEEHELHRTVWKFDESFSTSSTLISNTVKRKSIARWRYRFIPSMGELWFVSVYFYGPRFSSRVDLMDERSGMNLRNTKQSIYLVKCKALKKLAHQTGEINRPANRFHIFGERECLRTSTQRSRTLKIEREID